MKRFRGLTLEQRIEKRAKELGVPSGVIRSQEELAVMRRQVEQIRDARHVAGARE